VAAAFQPDAEPIGWVDQWVSAPESRDLIAIQALTRARS
jgi:hypothetical protein